MHIPDGFISPKFYLPSYAMAAGLWAVAVRRVSRGARALRAETVPSLAVLTALAFVLMMIAFPIPGGTTAHASGVALIAVVFGVWTAFLCATLVLGLQCLLFGVGGVTSLAVNALALGLVGGAAAAGTFRALRRVDERVALFAAGWLSVVLPSIVVAIVLGVQPAIAHRADGSPLFFPFGLTVTLPAVVLPHLLVGVGEGILTVLAYRLLRRIGGLAT